MSEAKNGCSGQQGQEQSQGQTNSKQVTPFNLGLFEVLLIFCLIILLTSSLYYNWPAVERILVDDKVFQNLCTKQEIQNAIDGMFVCDKQRIEIGNLALIIFYSEFVAFAIGGFLTDYKGVNIALFSGFVFGFSAFIILYYFNMNNFMVKVAFALWGMFGGFVFITSIHFPKMFPEAKSLADGMIILFDNLSNLTPLIIYKIMKKFDLRYYEAFGTYLLWGVFPAFVFTLLYIPNKIKVGQDNDNFKCLVESLKKHDLWLSLITYSAPVTCSIFYKKTFSTYFLKNQSLVKIFPIIMLFVFVPTLFIAALNQFMGVHITSAFLYVLYIISFICFLYPTKYYGLLSIILFVISTSAAEQQTMTYISENHPQNESTLMGVSYAVDFVLGFILQKIFSLIFNKSPMSILFIIIPIFLTCIAYSIYSHVQAGQNQKEVKGQNETDGFRILYALVWVVPFFILCIKLVFNYFNEKTTQNEEEKQSKPEYKDQKVASISVAFYSFSFYYVCNIFHVIVTIFRTVRRLPYGTNRMFYLILFLACFFIISQLFILIDFNMSIRHLNLSVFVILLFILKIIMYIFTRFEYGRLVIMAFSIFLVIYGKIFFQFIYMLAYYNFQISYVERCYKTSLFHWSIFLLYFMLFRFFYRELSSFGVSYFIMTTFTICFYVFYCTVLYNYFPYEMDKTFGFKYHELPVPSFKEFKMGSLTHESFSSRLVNVSLSICNLGVIVTLIFNKKTIPFFVMIVIIHLLGISYLSCPVFSINTEWNKYLELGSTSLSTILYLILFFVSMNDKYDEYIGRGFFRFILLANFFFLTISNSLSWLSIQNDLQKCCCSNGESDSCQCCCVNKEKKDCECCKKDGKCCCCCCKTKDSSCSCEPPCCTKCAEGKQCENCICKCVKKTKSKDDKEYLFCFYDCNFQKVDQGFLRFYLGTVIGWLLFIIYLGFSKNKVIFNSFR